MEGTIGEIRLFAGTFDPRGWAACDGRLMPIAQFQALFSVLGTQYGGDGRTTFALPKLEAPATGHDSKLHYVLCLEGIYPSRN